MAVQRLAKYQASDPFTRVPNAAIHDPALDLKARGLLLVMLSKPNGWRFSERQIADETGVGRDQLRTAMQTLIDAGYARREGEPGDISTEVYDRPQAWRVSSQPDWSESDQQGGPVGKSHHPRSGNPTGDRSENPTTRNNGGVTKESNEGEPPVDARASTRVEPDDGFEEFWDRYPRGKAGKPGGDGSKTKARQRWRNMTQQQRALALAAVDNYRDWVERPEGSIPAHAVTWLNQNRWEQWQEPADPWAGRKVSNAERFEALADELERREQGGQG